MNEQSPFSGLPLAEKLSPIKDPMPGSTEADFARLRHDRATDTSSMYWLPQGPDEWAHEIYERVDAAERSLVAPNRVMEEYLNGTAKTDDEVAEIDGHEGGILFSAEHATNTPRLNKETGQFTMGFADVGTAGMASVLAEDYGKGLIMKGRQTKLPTDSEFGLKVRMEEMLPSYKGFVSVHASSSRPFVRPTDQTGIHAHLGLGIEPTAADRSYAEQIANYGRNELGLYVVVGNDQEYYVQNSPEGTLRRNSDGSLYTGRLAAQKPYMTVNLARKAYELQNQLNRKAIQVEMAPLLLPTAYDGSSRKDHKSEVMGVALGYMLLAKISELAIESAKES